MKLTTSTKAKTIERAWHLIDVNGKILGREATRIASLLIGKSKPYFVQNLDCGDYVVVIHAATVAVTGKKEEKKLYQNYSGYPGGLKEKPLQQVRRENPTRIVLEAVAGMLPKNKLRDSMLKRLFVFADDKHPYGSKFSAKGGSALG